MQWNIINPIWEVLTHHISWSNKNTIQNPWYSIINLSSYHIMVGSYFITASPPGKQKISHSIQAKKKHDHYPIQKTSKKKTHFLRKICMATCCATSLRPELHPRSAVDFVPTDWGRQVAPCNDGFGGGVPRPETEIRNGQWWLNSIEPTKM